MKKKIIFFSGSRAEYYIQSPILKQFQNSKKFDSYFIISGSHTSKSFGATFNFVRNDKIKIYKKIVLKITSNKNFGLGNYTLKLQRKITKILLKLKPDLIFLTSDRFETLSVALVAHLLNIPIIHLEGGDVTEGGTLDDNSRHAITKLASLHLVTNTDSEKRVLMLGEERKRIINVGFPPLSKIKKKNLFLKDQIEKKINLTIDGKLIIFTYHPVPNELNKNKEIFAAISFLSRKGFKFIITYPNFDPGYKSVLKKIESLKHHKNISIIKNLGQKLYFSILNYIGKDNKGLCIGNSSSGIKESMFFNCKVINLGSRQKSRFKTKNIYECPLKKKKIITLFNSLINKKINYAKFKNPYFSSERVQNIDYKIYKKIKKLDLKVKKITY